jgi:hypothetical protein
MQIASCGLFSVSAALSDEKELASFLRRRLDGPERLSPADEERHGDIRENNDVAEREDG